jgi:hypothetical protein
MRRHSSRISGYVHNRLFSCLYVLIDGVSLPNKKFHTLRATKTSANRIALRLRLGPPLAIIRPMTWDEFQNLRLEVARAVGAEYDLRAVLAEPEDFHDPAFEFKPMMARRWGFFRRRPQLREIALAFYRPDDQTKPYCIMLNWVDLNELDKLDASAHRRELAASLHDVLEEKRRRT